MKEFWNLLFPELGSRNQSNITRLIVRILAAPQDEESAGHVFKIDSTHLQLRQMLQVSEAIYIENRFTTLSYFSENRLNIIFPPTSRSS
jgi:hypothetical protein